MGHNFFKLAVYSLNSYQNILDLNLPVISSNSISTNAIKNSRSLDSRMYSERH